MSKCTVYLVVFAEDLNVEIDTHVIRTGKMDGMGLLKIPNSKEEALAWVLRGNLQSRQGLPCTLFGVLCITTPLYSVVSPLSIKGAWIIYIYICMHTPPSPASIYFATSRHRYSDSHLTKKIRDFPSFLQGFFSWRGGGGHYFTRVERMDGCD